MEVSLSRSYNALIIIEAFKQVNSRHIDDKNKWFAEEYVSEYDMFDATKIPFSMGVIARVYKFGRSWWYGQEKWHPTELIFRLSPLVLERDYDAVDVGIEVWGCDQFGYQYGVRNVEHLSLESIEPQLHDLIAFFTAKL